MEDAGSADIQFMVLTTASEPTLYRTLGQLQLDSIQIGAACLVPNSSQPAIEALTEVRNSQNEQYRITESWEKFFLKPVHQHLLYT